MRQCLAAGTAGLAGWSPGFGVSMERPELGCLLAGLKLDEELQLLLGRVFLSAGRLNGCGGHFPPQLVCNSAAWLLLLHHFNL